MKNESEDEKQKNQNDPRNIVGRQEREKQFRNAGDNKQVYTIPSDIYDCLARYSKTFKSVKNLHPKNKDLTIIDFSLAARGPQEDEIYSNMLFYRNNVRRGNSVIVNNKTKEVYWGRKGLKKFFDISEKSLNAIINSDIAGLRKKDQNVHYAIFSQIENVLSCNDELQPQNQAKCHVYRLNKANGENAQISYFPLTQQWVISSKNVSVMVSERADCKRYEEERYQFAILMAQAWFNIIDNRKKAELEQLKAELTGKTIIGEYCGNPQYQHLVKYNQITIFFYAVVVNMSKETCLPPNQAFRFLQKYHIPIVKNHQNSYFGKFTSFTELGENLQKLFNQIATSSIFEDEQGSVVYFVLEKPKIFCQFVSDRYLQASVPIPENYNDKDTWFNVASLGKVKTLEYRILRKLRQKLKFFTRTKKGAEESKDKNQNDQKKLEQKYGSFQKQVHHLVKQQELSKPLEYYFCAAIVAFEYVFKNRKNPRNLELMSDHYLDFLSIIFWSIENKKEVTVQMMNNQEFHKQLRQTNWQKYSIEVVQHYQEMLEKLAPRYAKIKKTLNMDDEAEEVQADD